MLIGIAGLPELTHNYMEALQLAFSQTAESPYTALQRCRTAPGLKIEVSLSPERAACWDALLLPGGGDIDPALLPGNPPADPHCHDIDPKLDRQQLFLLNYFVRQKKPVLGICKGMQLICLYFGGGLIQHLPTAQTHCYKECDQFHPSHAAPDSFLFQLYGGCFTVNSAHHQGIVLPSAASSRHSFPLAVIQTAADGVPEGVICRTLPILGLQWHPERLCGRFARADAADGRLVFSYFLSLCG